MDEANTVPDGYLSFEGGVDSGFVPTLLRENETAWAINTTCRGGFLKPRPGFHFRQLLFPNGDIQTAATEAQFQGAGTYIADDGTAYLTYSASGRIFSIQLPGFMVREITIPGDPNSPTQPHAWFQQAEQTLVVQNTEQEPFFWNGVSSRRSIVNTQVPVGGPMAYLKGRLWVADGSDFYGGDLVNSYPALGRQSVLEFQENTFLNEGGAFSAAGPIRAMAVAANIDTTLGDGDLLIFTTTRVYAFNAPADRDTWKNLRYPIQRVALTTAGAFSSECVTNLNKDLLFRSSNGINSFSYARGDFEQWGNTPISRQVERAIQWDTQERLSECSAAHFDNRMLMTVQPIWVPNRGMIHRGLVALDYHLVSGMGRKTDPAWEGVWTGLQILRILTIQQGNTPRCFVFALDEDNKIALWELTKDERFDVGPDGEDTRIQWSIESRAFTYATPRKTKKLLSLEQWYDSLTGQLDIAYYFRPNLMECWTPWNAWSACAKYKECEPEEECSPTALRYFRQQVRPRIALPQPPDTVDVQTGGIRNHGYDFQFRMVLTGYGRLNRLVTTATLPGDSVFGDIRNVTCVETPKGACDTNNCKELVCCDPDDFAYAIPSESEARAFIRGTVYLRTPDEPGEYDIWSGRVGMDAAGDWITDPASLLIPQFSFWGGLQTVKLALVTQTEIDGVFPYTSVVGGTLSDQTYGAAKSAATPPWAQSISIQQFDPAVLGDPVSVDITSTITVRCSPRVQNMDLVAAQDVTVGMTGTVVFEYPSLNLLVSLPSTTQTTQACSAYVFPTDFAGPSGFVVDPPISNTDNDAQTITDSSPEWASLLGGGTASWPLTASKVDIASSDPGPTNLTFEQGTPEISAEISMEWHYHPFEGYWIFCIDNAAPWEPTSFSIPMATLADLGGPAVNRGEINGFGYELVEDFSAKVFKYFRSAAQVVAGGGSVTVVGTEALSSAVAPFPGIDVKLYADEDPLGPVLRSTVSGPDGTYGFDNIEAGSYTIKVTIPDGYVIDPDSAEEIDRTLTPAETSSGNDFYLNPVE